MGKQGFLRWLSILSTTALLAACGANPRNVDMDINKSLPETNVTIFQKAIYDLGLMNEIYGRSELRIMSKSIVDNTGTSIATTAEIPRDVTEMIKSTLNSISGGIIYIPFDPEFMLNAANTGYSGFENKIIPEVVLSGGITEFDRGLVTKGKNLEFDVEGKFEGKDIGLDFSDRAKDSLASITLDFNLIDFETFAGIPRIQAINNIKVHKALAEDALSFTILGSTVGVKGTIKKVQGRHAAVRLLVQLSMMQIIGKYQLLPYWRLLPEGQRDPVVINALMAQFYRLDRTQQIAQFQQYLFLHGKEVSVTGTLDAKTQAALSEFAAGNPEASGQIDQATFLALFESVPLSYEVRARRLALNDTDWQQVAATPAPSPATFAPPVTAATGGSVSLPGGVNGALSDDGQLAVWTETSNLRIGDTLKVHFAVASPMYVRILTVNSTGEVTTLFPNIYQPDTFGQPGQNYQIPPPAGPFSLEVFGPTGVDRIYAVASDAPLAVDDVQLTATGELGNITTANLSTRAALSVTIR